MANLDLDPLFVKALRLLHSKSKDSADQLKQLLDDVLVQRKGYKGPSSGSETKPSSTKSSSRDEEEKPRERKAEKHHIEKSQVKQDTKDQDSEVPAKKPRKDSPQVAASHSSEKLSESEVKKDDNVKKEKESHKDRGKKEVKKETEWKEEKQKEKEKEKEIILKDLKDSSSSDEEKSIDADDFAFGLGIACVVCKGFDVTSGNQLVECQECHTLYHQECHKPPVTEQDVNDPRFVWYCSRCSKSLKKMVSKPSKNKPSPTLPSKEMPETSKQTKSEPLFSFRRVEPKVSTSKDVSNNSGAKPMSGLASLAANLYSKGGDQVKTGSSKVEYTKSLLKPDLIKQSSTKSDSVEKVSLLKDFSKPGGKSPSETIKSSNKSSQDSGKSSAKSELSRSSSKSSSEQLKSSSKQPSSDVAKSSSKSSSSSLETGKSSSKSSSESSKSSSKFLSELNKSSSKSSSSELSKSSSKSSSEHSKLSSSKSSSSDSSKSSSKPPDSSRSSSKQGSSSSKQQPTVGGQASVVNADKRLQLMKKKAAAKLQEKRTSIK